jgi:hypothetical protein
MLLLLGTFIITDANKLERIQIKFAVLCRNELFQDIQYHYYNVLRKLNLQTLHTRRRHSDALLLIEVCNCAKCSPSLLETVGIRVPARNTPNSTIYSCSSSHYPSARCVSAANVVCKFACIFINSC